MLHELFLALSGNGAMFESCEIFGSCFSSQNIHENEAHSHHTFQDNKPDTNTINSANCTGPTVVIGSSPLFHPCEIKLISEILKVGYHFKRILKFYERVVSTSISVTDPANECVTRTGHYLTSLATAIYEETKPYQQKIVDLEHEYLENPKLLLSTILLNVSPFNYVFTELNHLIDVIEKKNLHGCHILDYLYRKVILSVGEIKEVFMRLKNALQKLLIEQLSHWLLYGDLIDPHLELFLKITKSQNQWLEDKEEKSQEKTNVRGESCPIPVVVSLDVEMLPEFLPLSAAEKILFIGESILCFEKGDMNSRSGLILKEKEKEFLDRFEALSLPNCFSLSDFLELIESVRVCVSKHLYHLVMEANLIAEMTCIKDIFLLGRGELYHALYILSENKRPNTLSVNLLFQRAGRLVMMEESAINKFVVTYKDPEGAVDREHIWKNLHINYKVKWPLHKFFDDKVQEKYNAILQFLLSIRRAQLRLQYMWIKHNKSKRERFDNFDVLCWTVRHHMCLLIYNIQYYIQVDVLESHYNALREEFSSQTDYQRLNFQHQAFLCSITTQCFLSHPIISSSINYILEKVDSFCNLLEAPPQPKLRLQVETLKEDFDRASSKFLWDLMSTLGCNKNSRHTSQLVLRINYNKFFVH